MRRCGILRLGVPLFLLLLLWAALPATAQAAAADAVWPESSGTVVEVSGKLMIDASHTDQGYIMVCVSEPTKHRMKVRMSYGGTQLTYDLNSEGMYETFPLQMGSGEYEFSLYENVKGNKYSAEGRVVLQVQLADENAAFLVTNQYVNYDLFTAAVQKSDELCAGQSQKEVYKAVTDFIASEFAYDFVRAKTISPGMLPEIDYCYANRMGICQDLSATTVCMLRVQGVPAKLMIGYAGKYYHAWITAIVDGEEIFFDPTVAVGALGQYKYTIERYY